MPVVILCFWTAWIFGDCFLFYFIISFPETWVGLCSISFWFFKTCFLCSYQAYPGYPQTQRSTYLCLLRAGSKACIITASLCSISETARMLIQVFHCCNKQWWLYKFAAILFTNGYNLPFFFSGPMQPRHLVLYFTTDKV